MINRSMKLAIMAFSVTAICLAGVQTANAIMIGAGSGITATSLDTAGSRMNIDGNSQSLAAGTYGVADFGYKGSTNIGNIQPFLAALTGTNSYTVVWVGASATSASGSVTTSYTPGAELFTLSGLTDIYAGFNASSNSVYFADGTGSTDHNNPANFALAIGNTISSFTNADLGRTYAFEVNVASVPDGGLTLILLGFGLAGIAALRRRLA